VLTKCSQRKSTDDATSEVPPNIWLRYRGDDQSTYRVKIPVSRLPVLGKYAMMFEKEKFWKFYDDYFQKYDECYSKNIKGSSSLSISGSGIMALGSAMVSSPSSKSNNFHSTTATSAAGAAAASPTTNDAGDQCRQEFRIASSGMFKDMVKVLLKEEGKTIPKDSVLLDSFNSSNVSYKYTNK
jgi:hypothetical protein